MNNILNGFTSELEKTAFKLSEHPTLQKILNWPKAEKGEGMRSKKRIQGTLIGTGLGAIPAGFIIKSSLPTEAGRLFSPKKFLLGGGALLAGTIIGNRYGKYSYNKEHGKRP